jgi:coproporphyrinogen III oxidase-like Fe-S oxidoreductase
MIEMPRMTKEEKNLLNSYEKGEWKSVGLRTKKGVSLQDFENYYHYDLFTEKKEMLDKLIEEGPISIQDGYLFPTKTGLAIADSLSLI